jgi:hypothetical protein
MAPDKELSTVYKPGTCARNFIMGDVSRTVPECKTIGCEDVWWYYYN